MKTLNTLATLALCLTTLTACGQFDIQLPLQYGIQQTIANPAALQDHKVSIALPSVSGGFFTPIAINDMGEVRSGTLFIDPDQFINRLNDRGNDQRFNINAETFAFNFRNKGWQVGVSHRVRASGAIDLPKGLVQLAAYGNARYVGQELQVMPIIRAEAFQEFALHGSATVWDNFTVGGRIKLLKGAGAMSTASAEARIYTDPDFYEATVSTNITVNTAGFPLTFDGTGVEFGELDGIANAGTGLGFDFGAVYRHEDKFEIGFSVRDIGSILWDGNANQHRSNGSFTFSGYQGNVFEDDGFDFDVAGTIDTIISEVQFVTRSQSFRTSLPTTVQGTFRYLIAPKTTLSATAYTANVGTWHSGFGVGMGQQVGQWLHVGALAGMRRGGGYLGANILFDIFGPQFYIACDNLLSVTNLNQANDAHFRAGLNLTFGKIKPGKNVKGWYDVKVEGINK